MLFYLLVQPWLKETAVPENNGANTELVSGESEYPTNEADKQHEGEQARENKPEKAEE